MSGLAVIDNLFEGHVLRMVPIHNEPCVAALDLANPLGISKSAIRNLIGGLDEADRHCVILNDAMGRPRDTIVLTESGTLQVISQSRKPEGRRLLKFMADLTVRWRRGEVAIAATQPAALEAPTLTAEGLLQMLMVVAERMADRFLSPRVALSADTRKRVALEDLPEWSDSEYNTMKRTRDVIWVPDFLFQETGKRYRNPSPVTKRIVSFCKENNLNTYLYRCHGSVRVLVPEQAAKAVFRSGWSTRNRVDALSESLFPQSQGEVIDLASRRSS